MFDLFTSAERAADEDAIQRLIDDGALFVLNHSGGKDSQAMAIKVRARVPAAQLLVIYAPLEGVVWPGTLDHIRETTQGLPLVLAHASKTFFGMVEHRGMFPSPKNRQCTSDLKRGPIEREIRQHLKAHPEFGGRIVNCMGMRAQESTGRAKLVTFKRNAANSIAGRDWYDWLPVHDMLTLEVFAAIATAKGEEIAGPNYEAIARAAAFKVESCADDESRFYAWRFKNGGYKETTYDEATPEAAWKAACESFGLLAV